MDADREGHISLEELRGAMLNADVGVSKEDMKFLFRKVIYSFRLIL